MNLSTDLQEMLKEYFQTEGKKTSNGPGATEGTEEY